MQAKLFVNSSLDAVHKATSTASYRHNRSASLCTQKWCAQPLQPLPPTFQCMTIFNKWDRKQQQLYCFFVDVA